MISVKDIWDELVAARKATRGRTFSEAELQYKRGYLAGLMQAYVTLTGEDAETVYEFVDDQLQREHDLAAAQDVKFNG